MRNVKNEKSIERKKLVVLLRILLYYINISFDIQGITIKISPHNDTVSKDQSHIF